MSTKKSKKCMYKIEKPYETLTSSNIEKLLCELQLEQAAVELIHTGSKPSEDNTISTYRKHIQGLRYFCSLIGDYESYLVLLPRPPVPFCPSMNPRTIADFIRFKRGKQGKPFVRLDCNEQCMDVLNKPVFCQGGWNDPRNVDQCLSALGAIHSSRGQVGVFEDRCVMCRNAQKQHKGCRIHPGKPQVWRKGNPCKTALVKDVMARSRKDGSGYVAEGDCALTPFEVMNMRNVLLSSNNIEDMRLYVMILLSIKLFLRSNEVVKLKIEDIIKEVSVVSNGVLECLAFKVQGKTDKKPVTLCLWADHDIPQLCPIRHLMAYLNITGVTTGFIFAKADGDHISYDKYQSDFTNVCEMLIERNGPFGTHSCRKTAYLFAVWGGGEEADIMTSARHKTMSNAVKYKKDAMYLLHLAKANDLNFASIVAKWKPILCSNVQMGRTINKKGSRAMKMLSKLAANFVLNLCHCDKSSSVLEIMEAVMNYQRKKTTLEEIVAICDSHLPSEILAELVRKIEQYTVESRVDGSIRQDVHKHIHDECIERAEMVGSQQDEVDDVLSKTKNVVDTAGMSRKRKRDYSSRGGGHEIDGREDIKRLNGQAKLMKIVQVAEHLPTNRSLLTESARNYAIRTLDPIVNCYRGHFNEDAAAFISCVGEKFSHSTFITKHCDGKLSCKLKPGVALV